MKIVIQRVKRAQAVSQQLHSSIEKVFAPGRRRP